MATTMGPKYKLYQTQPILKERKKTQIILEQKKTLLLSYT